MRAFHVSFGLVALILSACSLSAESPSLAVTELSLTNSTYNLRWAPYPAVESYRVERALTPVEVFQEELSGTRAGFSWSGEASAAQGFFRVVANPISDDLLWTANALNQIAYGPTPDELNRIALGPNPIGPKAFIEEQLAPETVPDGLDTEPPTTGWTRLSATGTATSGRLYIYLSAAGSVYIDDVKVVKGLEPEVGPNLIANGDFESALAPKWITTSNFAASAVSTDVTHSGNQSLLLVGKAAGTGSGNALYQDFAGFKAGEVYTVSLWYLPTNQSVKITERLSGATSGIAQQSIAPGVNPITAAYSKLSSTTGNLSQLRRWFVLRAIRSPRQLHEILTQFCENHFVTEFSKTSDYLNRFYSDGTVLDLLSTSLEFREISRWRNILLKPSGTFQELLQASAESPAQIIYLDTVDSRGDGSNIANENYSRELLELYTFGVDNGYDQNDIVSMSRAWTGWSIRLVDADKVSNPFAPQSTNRIDNTLTNVNNLNAVSNLVGVWSFGFRTNRHNLKAKTIFPGKVVPDRFGPPWAGRNYELKLPARSGVDAIQDGYDAIAHLANQPFTEEFISVKLCRLLVHDDFVHGQYDYRDPNLSEEGKLVHECMLAWENGSPKGQIRDVLRVILYSDLFRKHGGSMQKVKTPLEFCVSAIRALRADVGGGRFSASSDGSSISGVSSSAPSSPLYRMGLMRLFNRVEPDGYPESAGGWISAGTLAERARFIQSFLMPTSDASKADGIEGGNFNVSDPVALVKARVPSTGWSDAGTVVDYFLRTLFPAEGLGNLSDYRSTMVRFLNTSDDGLTASPFNLLGDATPAYDTRVRAMVSVLMSSPRFQEQ